MITTNIVREFLFELGDAGSLCYPTGAQYFDNCLLFLGANVRASDGDHCRDRSRENTHFAPPATVASSDLFWSRHCTNDFRPASRSTRALKPSIFSAFSVVARRA